MSPTGDPQRSVPPVDSSSGKPLAANRPTTVSGTVVAGVEAGCRLLATENGSYLLLGVPAAELRVGDGATVTGRVDRSIVSTCQQGIPLVVERVNSVTTR